MKYRFCMIYVTFLTGERHAETGFLLHNASKTSKTQLIFAGYLRLHSRLLHHPQDTDPPSQIRSQRPGLCSISSVQLQVNLHPIADRIVRQTQTIMERPLSLPLKHDLMHGTPDLGRHHGLQHLDGVRRQTWDLCFGAQTIVDGDDDHGLARGGHGGGGLLVARGLIGAPIGVPVAVVSGVSAVAVVSAIAPAVVPSIAVAAPSVSIVSAVPVPSPVIAAISPVEVAAVVTSPVVPVVAPPSVAI